MKRILNFWLILLSVGFLTGCSSASEADYLFRVSLWANEEHTWYKAFLHFGDLLAERSEGRMKVEVYPSEQLAKEKESIRLIQAEVIEMTGLRPVAVFERGPRHLTSNRPIRHPDDLQGLILRVPSVPSFVTAWSAMGAKPTPMAFSEVFTSLQQGTIEAQENPFELILNAGFPEVQQYVNLTEHVMSWSYPVVGEKQFQRLPADLQAIFLQAAQEMQAYERRLFLESEKKVQDELKSRGMKFIEVDKDAFAAECEEAIFNSLSPESQELYKEFQASRK